MIATTCNVCRGEGSVLEEPCKDCRGEGRVAKHRKLSVKIPPGVDTGTQLLLQGEGEAGRDGAGRGALYVFVHVEGAEPHHGDPRFTRENETLHLRADVSFSVAALGGEIEVPTLEGPRKVHVPRGTETGEKVILEGHGFPQLRSRRKGDLVIHFKVVTPKHLSKKQEELLKELAVLSHETVSKKKGFFS